VYLKEKWKTNGGKSRRKKGRKGRDERKNPGRSPRQFPSDNLPP